MKIKRLKFDNFRVYNTIKDEPFTIDIENKPIVLIYGNNGMGKSSLFDGIEWGITGKIERYNVGSKEKNKYHFLKNHFTNRNDGFVEVEFDNGFLIKREILVKGKSDYNSGKLININKGEISKTIINEDYSKIINIENQFNTSHLLSQELLNNFIKSKKETERYETFLAMYGLSSENKSKDKIKESIKKIKELYEESNNEISQLNSQIKENQINLKGNNDLNKYEESETFIKTLLKAKNLSDINLEDLREEYLNKKIKKDKELKEVKEVNDLLKKKEHYKEINKKIEKERIKLKRLIQIIEALKMKEKLERVEEGKKEYILYKSKVQNYEVKVNEKINVDIKIGKISKIKEEAEIINHYKGVFNEKYIEYNEQLENIKRLKDSIALKEKIIDETSKLSEAFLLSSKNLLQEVKYEKCPLCDNEAFEREEILMKLEKEINEEANPRILEYQLLIKEEEEALKKVRLKNEELLSFFKAKLDEEINEAQKNKDILSEYFSSLKKLETNYNLVNKALKYLRIEIEGLDDKRNEIINILEGNIKNKTELEKEGDELESYINKINTEDVKKFNKLQIEGEEIDKKREADLKEECNKIDFTLETANYLINAKKENESLMKIEILENAKKEKELEKNTLSKGLRDYEIIKKEIDELIFNEVKNKSIDYKDKIQNIFSLLNPHKDFNEIKLNVSENTGNMNNGLIIEVSHSGEDSNNPAFIFSSAQTNVLAISIFLTFALDTKWSKLDTILLDDPIQNMDDINIYAFVDLIRKISDTKSLGKQIFISTHDERIKDFMMMKFGKENVQLIEFTGYGKIKSNYNEL